jgi:hypothetical protein
MITIAKLCEKPKVAPSQDMGKRQTSLVKRLVCQEMHYLVIAFYLLKFSLNPPPPKKKSCWDLNSICCPDREVF